MSHRHHQYHFDASRQAKMSSCDLKKETDRISELPDGIITHILSFLSLKEALVTSVLSRRWTKQWQYYDKRLHFDYDSYYISCLKDKTRIMDEKLKFIIAVNRVLISHKAPTIEQFRVRLELDAEFKTQIDLWIKFALKRNVQRLELHLNSHRRWPSENKQYCLQLLSGPPNIIITCEDLRSLRSLSLKGVDVTGEVVEKILASCPVLEQLIISESQVLKRLKVSGPSLMLKYLDIGWCFPFESLEMSNLRNLIGFKYIGYKIDCFVMNNVRQLEELSLGSDCLFYMDEFIPKFSPFSMLGTLELGVVHCSEFGGEFCQEFKPPELPSLRSFTLHVPLIGVSDECLLGYTRFMEVAPLLEKFILRETWERYPLVVENGRGLRILGQKNWVERELPLRAENNRQRRKRLEVVELEKKRSRRHERLEVVELDGYCGITSEEELVRYFIQSSDCTSLKRIIVHIRDVRKLESLQEENYETYFQRIMRKKAAFRHAQQHLSPIIPPHVDFIINFSS